MPLPLTMALAFDFSGPGPDGAGSIVGSFLLAISPLLIAFAVVLPSLILIGLPATFILGRLNAESLSAYVAIGAVAGFLITIAVLDYTEAGGWWIGMIGAFSGGMTARTWWFSAREPIIE